MDNLTSDEDLPEETVMLLAEQERMLKSIRRWVRLWRTNEIHSSSAMGQISIDFDTASKRYDN